MADDLTLETSMQDSEEAVIVNKICCALSSEDKRERKGGLLKVDAVISEQNVDADFIYSKLYKPVLRCFSDKAEVCRELAANVIKNIVVKFDDTHVEDLTYVIPVILQRIGGQDILEPSEEVRYILVSLLHEIVKKHSAKLGPFVEDIVQILSKSLVDPFPKVKCESCDCTVKVARLVPTEFYDHSGLVIKPLLKSFTFQQYKIRSSAVKTVGVVIRYGNNKLIDEVVVPVVERLFDQNPMVRQITTQVVGDWLLNLPDRYSFFSKLLPLILTSLCDELEDLRSEANDLWEKIGQQYYNENEEDLKDKFDFLSPKLKHYPPDLKRPHLGCRALVRHHLFRIVPALVGDLDDWRKDVRVKSSQLLCVLIQNAEGDLTHHLEKLLPGMYRAARDEEIGVVKNVEKASELLGHFIPPEIYCKLIIPTMDESPSFCHLKIFAGVILGSEKELLNEKLEEIANFLAKHEICWSREGQYQLELLKCCSALMQVSGTACSTVYQQIFYVLISVLGLAADKVVQRNAEETFYKLEELEDCSAVELYRRHVLPILEEMETTVASWCLQTYEKCIFDVILLKSGPVFGLYLKNFENILKELLRKDGDPEVKLKIFTILSGIFTTKQEALVAASDPNEFIITFINDMIIPNLVWKAGRTAESIRTVAVACLCGTLENPEMSPLKDAEVVKPISEVLLPSLLSLVEDMSRKSRVFSLRAICQVVWLLRYCHLFSSCHIQQIFPVVLKRLDDVSDEVRTSAVETLQLIFCPLPPDFSIESSRAPVESLYNTLLIHLDDPEERFRAVMLRTLKDLSNINPPLMKEILITTRNNFRNSKGCEELLKYLENVGEKT